MFDEEIVRLLRQAPFSFVGTIEHLGAATMVDVPVDDRTAVVRIERVLHAPDEFVGLQGNLITIQLAADTLPPQVEQTFAFFAQGLAFGESIAVAEVGRLPLEAVAPRLNVAMAAGGTSPFDELLQGIERDRLREHAANAAAIVIGRVIKLEKALPSEGWEHDPDWWRATIYVHHVERGDLEPGPVDVLYANSIDVKWQLAPKPRASQAGVWILHPAEGRLAETARFQIIHPEDFQPVQSLDALREGKG
jgi:hypothetical protein